MTSARRATRSSSWPRELIAIDTTNTGEPDGTVGEREAAEYVAAKLTEVGYEVELLDSGRARAQQRLLPAARRGPRARRAARPRPPRRRARRAGGVVGAPVLRRGAGRLRVGPRRRRHEGHGRDDDRGRPPVPPRRRRAAARPRLRLPRRRGGGRRARGAVARRAPAGPLRGLHRGRRRGGRLLADRERAADLPRSRPRRRAWPGCGCGRAGCRGTGRSCTTTTPSPRWPRPSRGSATTGSR